MNLAPADLDSAHRGRAIQRLAAVIGELSDLPANQVLSGAELQAVIAALADASACFGEHRLIASAADTASPPQRSGDLLLAARLLEGSLHGPASSR